MKRNLFLFLFYLGFTCYFITGCANKDYKEPKIFLNGELYSNNSDMTYENFSRGESISVEKTHNVNVEIQNEDDFIFPFRNGKISKNDNHTLVIESKFLVQDIEAIASGVIVYAGLIDFRKKTVIIAHDHGYISTYSNLDDITVIKNQTVKQAQKIGTIKFDKSSNRTILDFSLQLNNAIIDPKFN